MFTSLHPCNGAIRCSTSDIQWGSFSAPAAAAITATLPPRHHVRSMDLGRLLSSGGVLFAPGHGTCGDPASGDPGKWQPLSESQLKVQRATILESMLVSLPAPTYVFYATCF